jgi:carbon storage regulator
MLVLSRKVDEQIVCTHPDGTRIELTIVAIRGEKVRIGLTAPQTIEINRGEVQELVDAEKCLP